MSKDVPRKLRSLNDDQLTARIVKQKIWQRCNQENDHFMGAVVGREGTGKSYTAMTIAKIVDPTFRADRVFFSPKRLLETLQSDQYDAGTAVVVDEAGVGVGARTWYEKEQVVFNQALQTARDDNLAVLFTLPRLNELDSQTRGRLHAVIEMVEVKANKYAKAKWFNISLSRKTGRQKIYHKYPRLEVNGTTDKVQYVKFGPPHADLVQQYEGRKARFKDELYEDAISQYEADEDEDKDTDPRELAENATPETLRNVVRAHGRTGAPIVDKDFVRTEFEVSHADARTIKSLLEQQHDTDELAEFI